MSTTEKAPTVILADGGPVDLLVNRHGQVCATVDAGHGIQAARLWADLMAASARCQWTKSAIASASLDALPGFTEDVATDANGDLLPVDQFPVQGRLGI